MSNFKIFVDCGAPSLYNKLSRKTNTKGVMGTHFADRKFDDFSYTELPEYAQYRKDYISFISRYKKDISVYSNLDVINNPKQTWQNQKFLEAEGINPIPVFHLGSDVKWLKRYLDNYEYIALGGLIPNPTSVLIPMLDSLFKEYLLDEKGFPRVKLHGFACTSVPLMLRYPWYSVDSATSRKIAAYGGILFPEKNKNRFQTISTSTRDMELRFKLSGGLLAEINSVGTKYDFSISDLVESGTNRTIWNHLMFVDLIDKVATRWPWNFYTKESIGTHLLDVYFAGALSKKESILFWEKLESLNIEKKCRLVSHFYKTEAEFIINTYSNENK